MILSDTTFLIDLQRSSRNIRHQAAANWLAKNAEIEIGIPVVVHGEFAEGFDDWENPLIEHIRSAHQIIVIDERVAMIYGQISRTLRMQGNAIGSNDTWIAATGLALRTPLLTRNIEHFKRVEGLQIEAYGVESS